MTEPVVERIELLAVGPDGDKVTWAAHLGPMNEAMILACLTLSNGVEAIAGTTAYTEHEFDRTAFAACALTAPFVLGRGVHTIPAFHADMSGRHVPLRHVAVSLFDIALHDGKARTLGLPLYRMFGAARETIRAYASSPLLPVDADYVDYCERMLAAGFRAIKIHPYGRIEEDLSLVNTLIEAFAGRAIGWGLDTEGRYTRAEALRMGRVLDRAGWEFFEAPLPDSDLDGYRALAAALDLDVICSGNALVDLNLIALGLRMGAWDRARFDVTGIGGFTGGRDAMAIARAHGARCEVQSWGYTLTQAANLHLMLSDANCGYFEQAAPFERYEFGARQSIRPDADGNVAPSGLPGLGIEMDRDALEPFVYARRSFAPG